MDTSSPSEQFHSLKPSKGFARFKRAFNGKLLYACALIALSQVNFGMDLGAFGGTQAMPMFKKQFGMYNPITKTYVLESSYLSLLNSLTYIGFGFGVLSGSFISNRFGRRSCLWTMSIWAIIGAAIMVTAKVKEQMMAGRIIAYVYIGMELSLVPVLQSELVPAEVRGFVVGTYASGLLTGQLIQNVITRATSELDGNKSWRIPLGLLFVIPILLLVGVKFVPESPRWLLIKNRREEALTALRQVREGTYSEAQIQAEFRSLQTTIDLTVEKGRFIEIFQNINLKRTLIVIGTNIVVQATGQNLWTQYGTLYIQSLGVINPFTMTTVNTAIAIAMVLLGQYLTDLTGRVPLLMISSTLQIGIFATMGALGTVSDPSRAVRTGATVMLTLFGACLQFSWSPLFHAVVAEVPTQRLRDQTYAVGCVFNVLTQWTVSFSLPYLLFKPRNLGPQVGFIFCFTSVVSLLFAYFCIPECFGKTLEEVDQLFLERVPIRKFRNARPTLPGMSDLETAKMGTETDLVVHEENAAPKA
ncbi:uncharacterized protein A1O9_04227 [Exophiala aquamarina CBS 119918]|uniref:Major facilitator superfamily (MFS) profile domain-containing protein n=1 Tax=Exophiala aquamarina CBS 119918 TaxID=1182545 RepID=A0A072PJ99_9EURO|nr:uncharacterized protein A1O9_04227 [Exophiala aquamarina CBS 119918]KEF59383.1 hypothetical protein A1O9_04227 [Exophiala aquamarina CBS 119918]